VLEEGNKDDWFGSPFIVRLSLIAAVALILFVAIELRVRKPLLNLRLLLRRNFGFGVVANFLMGFALYGSVFILPLYLSRVQGYNSEQIGFVLAWTGIPQLFLIPLVPQLMKRFDVRLVIGVGFALFAASNFMNITMSPDTAAPQLLRPNVVRAIGQALAFMPLTAVATAGIEPENAGSASSLFNMMRNLGGAIGIAALQTFQIKREQFHSNVLMQAVSLMQHATRARIDMLSRYFLAHGTSDPAMAANQAVTAVGDGIRLQANVMGFSDTFYVLGCVLAIALLATLCFRKVRPGAGAAAH
ncbi:MAG TPA: MFS transporter, partial [Acetobacteraceae bacterium]|nr:MFS transporter [Acetobacteraceae bacterium]